MSTCDADPAVRAGYTRVLSDDAYRRLRGRANNIQHSVLPGFSVHPALERRNLCEFNRSERPVPRQWCVSRINRLVAYVITDYIRITAM
ncbi:conserved hypothetical protein [Rhodococcus jostii RHA1]|uniref:Uncharacterized protein n=1 Tax=Rhodococcus jostii (strain RHA1) TaxID=101510 RepID=Q0SCP6_RHOJR|nr:conserved hypothetical protein [Rhodococcus jostii RHA1]